MIDQIESIDPTARYYIHVDFYGGHSIWERDSIDIMKALAYHPKNGYQIEQEKMTISVDGKHMAELCIALQENNYVGDEIEIIKDGDIDPIVESWSDLRQMGIAI